MTLIRHRSPSDPDLLVEKFFEGWPTKPSQERFNQVLRGSGVVLVAEEEGKVVGFLAGLTDGALYAFITLLEVIPSHRGKGIGTDLVQHFADECKDLYACDLVCDPDLVPFYERAGFTPYTAMLKRNRTALP